MRFQQVTTVRIDRKLLDEDGWTWLYWDGSMFEADGHHTHSGVEAAGTADSYLDFEYLWLPRDSSYDSLFK